MSIHFHVGQKVVCVDADVTDGIWVEGEAPEKGRVYTVKGVHLNNRGEVVLHLHEIDRADYSKVWHRNHNLGYGAYRFRPVVERETDISLFTAMLTPTKKTVEA